MTTPPAPLTVGVVLYQNELDEVARLITSLEQARRSHGAPAFQLAWFDNTGREEYRRSLAGLGITAVAHSNENLGFGRAHNRLMAEAFSRPETRWYLCMNPDGIAHPDMLAELSRQLGRMAKPGLVEALQFPSEHPKTYDPATNATPWCSGCALLITRELYRAIGGYDDQIFLYCEDVDLSWRARVAGFEVAVAPGALVHHFTGNRAPGGRTRIEMVRAGAYLAAKWGDSRFERTCRQEYQTLTGEKLQLPASPRPNAAMKAVADFSQEFHFARPRW